jgi:two-component system, chemotaxis family, response regulator Rcp1
LHSDGKEAVVFLRQEGAHIYAVRPTFILLDLGLPRMDGREVLNFIKTDAGLRMIPTIILSMSDENSGIYNGYELQANCYFSKPEHYDGFASMINGIMKKLAGDLCHAAGNKQFDERMAKNDQGEFPC